jgi:hypothetical protein
MRQADQQLREHSHSQRHRQRHGHRHARALKHTHHVQVTNAPLHAATARTRHCGRCWRSRVQQDATHALNKMRFQPHHAANNLGVDDYAAPSALAQNCKQGPLRFSALCQSTKPLAAAYSAGRNSTHTHTRTRALIPKAVDKNQFSKAPRHVQLLLAIFNREDSSVKTQKNCKAPPHLPLAIFNSEALWPQCTRAQLRRGSWALTVAWCPSQSLPPPSARAQST